MAQNSAKADAADDTTPNVSQKYILVAEDSPITQDLLKLVLEQHGHTVDIADDGEKALAALRRRSYDAALIDFHLPKINGLKVIENFLEADPQAHRPRFIAITADVQGLLNKEASCENFDEVIAKPFDIDQVLYAIKNEKGSTEATESVTLLQPKKADPANVADAIWRQFELLHWPDDLSTNQLPSQEMRVEIESGKYDGILVKKASSVRDFSVLWTSRALHLLPIIDTSGTMHGYADFDASQLKLDQIEDLDRLVRSFRDNRTRLHQDLIYTDDVGEKLIGRIFVMGGTLRPRYDPGYREFISYNTALDFQSIEKEINDLLARGLVEKEFFDRFHSCPRCGSSRTHVREQCPNCASSNLEEEAYLHHFKCAYQGPESDFVRGKDLICPKCRRELSHFSVDYDKPGSMMKCRSCSHSTSEPAIGFICVDCSALSSPERMQMRDVFSFRLTEQGMKFTEAGRALLEGRHAAVRFAGLPLALLVALDSALKEFKADRQPFTLFSLSYRNAREIELSEGLRIFTQSRTLFLENLGNTVRKEDRMVKGRNYDYVLIRGVSPDDALADFKTIVDDAADSIRIDLGIEFEAFGPEDFN